MEVKRKMSLKSQHLKVAYATMLMAVVAAVFLAASTAINFLDVSAVPPIFYGTVYALKEVFSLPVSIFVVAWIRGIYGYYRSRIQAQLAGQPELEYKLGQFGQTVGLYVTAGIAAFTLLSPPYNNLAVAVVFVVDVVKSELSYFFNQPAPNAPTPPPGPQQITTGPVEATPGTTPAETSGPTPEEIAAQAAQKAAEEAAAAAHVKELEDAVAKATESLQLAQAALEAAKKPAAS
jgi:hypothetical protein